MPQRDLRRLIPAARGDRPVDLLIRNARLVNVFLGEVRRTDIAVSDGWVVGFGAYRANREIDLKGRFAAPGFIDAHVHIESAMVGPVQFARAVLPHGTTCVVADPHEIANVLGLAGIDYMLSASENLPLTIYYTLSSCVPATHMESSGARLTAADLAPMMSHPRVVGLAEMMNYPGVIHEETDVLAKIEKMRAFGKPVDGHAPGLAGKPLNAYIAAGIGSDHECVSVAEAREKLAAGMHIMVREGTGARNLKALLPLVKTRASSRMMWCTDDRHPHDLLAEGHVDSIVRQAVRQGVDPMIAIRMATLNPAEYFRLDTVGAVAPGRRADLVVMDDLNHPVARQVYVGGELAAEDGRLSPRLSFPDGQGAAGKMRAALKQPDLKAPARTGRMRVIGVVAGQIITRSEQAAPLVKNGLAVSDTRRDLLKLVVVERHHGTGAAGVGFVRGFGLQKGALASTVAHDAHNIVAVGVTDDDIMAAVADLVAMNGGLAAVADERVLARAPLPIAGLMSDQPVEVVRDQLDGLNVAARSLGAVLPDPFMTLGFMALPVIPALKLTDQGLVDVARFEIVPLFV